MRTLIVIVSLSLAISCSDEAGPSDTEGPSSICADGQCDAEETPDSCPEDCSAPASCGNGVCDAEESITTCPQDCVESCTPGCSGKTCGDDGCGASCGMCENGQACLDGQCEDTCTPDCDQKQCGDDGCGSTCGMCDNSQSCVAGGCIDECLPDCDQKQCGDDGCGATCGMCETDQMCVEGACEDSVDNEVSYTVTLDDGSSQAVSFDQDTPNANFACSIDTAANTLNLELDDGGDHLIRIRIASDPIGFCLFSTAAFEEFTYQRFSQGALDTSYGIDQHGQTMGVQLSCTDAGDRIEGTFFTGRLFENRNSNVFPQSNARITEGTFDCAL